LVLVSVRFLISFFCSRFWCRRSTPLGSRFSSRVKVSPARSIFFRFSFPVREQSSLAVFLLRIAFLRGRSTLGPWGSSGNRQRANLSLCLGSVCASKPHLCRLFFASLQRARVSCLRILPPPVKASSPAQSSLLLDFCFPRATLLVLIQFDLLWVLRLSICFGPTAASSP
jgi:hypothetical protein